MKITHWRSAGLRLTTDHIDDWQSFICTWFRNHILYLEQNGKPNAAIDMDDNEAFNTLLAMLHELRATAAKGRDPVTGRYVTKPITETRKPNK